jgi:hypothetical protein
MATDKKTTVKKASTVKKSPVVKKAVTRSASSKKTVSNTPQKMRSFRVSPNNPTFKTFKITRQTLYWVIIVSFIIFMQLWIVSMQLETSDYIENQMTEIQTEQ